MSAPVDGRVTVIIPAKDEEARIGPTVQAATTIPGVGQVVVVDDGSSDRTAVVARAAGAYVVRHARNRGKAAAMRTGANAAADTGEESLLLFLDADLQETACAAAPLIDPVARGSADMTIAILPAQSTPGGGRGLVVDLARDGIRRATGWVATQPLSGQRCLTPMAFRAALPLASGFGVETGLTIDLLRHQMRVLEVPCELHHRVTGKDFRAQVHRARQYRDVAVALGRRDALPERLDHVLGGVARRSAGWRQHIGRTGSR